MSRFLHHSLLLLSAPLGLGLLTAACGDDTTTTQTTSSSSSTGGSGGAPTTSSSSAGGTGGVGGVGGTGGMPPMECMGPKTGTDACDGEVVNLPLGSDITLCGEITEMNNNDYQGVGCVAESAGGDNVYDVKITQNGSLKIEVVPDVGSTLRPTTYLRLPGECTNQTPAANGGCDVGRNTCIAADWDAAFVPGGFHLIQDAAPDMNNMPTTGGYVMRLSLQPAACGDGVWNLFTTTEECDDGNLVAGDGCSPTCTIEPNTLFDDCPGNPIPAGIGNPVDNESANTTGTTDNHTPSPVGSCMGVEAGGPEKVYRVTAQDTGTMTVTVGLDATCTTSVCQTEGSCDPGCWDYVLWATDAPQNDCGNTTNQLACSDVAAKGPETISFPVVSGNDYFVFVDGYDSLSFGAYNLCVTVAP